MSTKRIVKKECGNCHQIVTVCQLCSSNSFGSPDLDLRSPGMIRHTMGMWLEECTECGYVSANVEQISQELIDCLNSREYIECHGIDFKSELAKRFYRKHILAVAERKNTEAYERLLHAAWCCDDASDIENAILCRRKMHEFFVRFHESYKKDMNRTVRHVDVLRRSMMFDEAIEMCDNAVADEEIFKKIIEFEREKCKQRDTKAYTVAHALGNFK